MLTHYRPGSFWHFDRGPILRRLLLAGRQEALDYMSAALDSTQATGSSSGEFQGKHVERKSTEGDSAAQAIAEWRSDGYQYDSIAPDEQRAAERERLKQWLKQKVELVRQGKPSALSGNLEPIHAAHWQVDAP